MCKISFTLVFTPSNRTKLAMYAWMDVDGFAEENPRAWWIHKGADLDDQDDDV